MSKVSVTKEKLDILANAIANKSGEPLKLTLDEMVEAVDGIETGGGEPNLQAKTYTVDSAGTETVTADSGYDGLSEVEVSVPEADPYVYHGTQYVTQNNLKKWQVRGICDIDDEGEDHSGYIGLGTYYGSWQTYSAVPANTSVTPTTSAQTIGGANYMMEGAVTVNAMPSMTLPSSTSATSSGTSKATISASSSTQYLNIPTGYNATAQYYTISASGGGSLTVATKTLTNTATTQTLSFTSLSGQPKYWFLRATTNVSSSGSTTYYYVTDCFYDGTNIKGNTFRIGSTRRVQNITSGITQSYSGETLTITAGSASTTTPGQFYGASNFGYELVYIY